MFLRSPSGEAIRQGEILTGVRAYQVVAQEMRDEPQTGDDSQFIESIRHPYAVVLTQDCDLAQDFRDRRALSSAEEFKKSHRAIPTIFLLEVSTAMELKHDPRRYLNSKEMQQVVRNNHLRYHFIEKTPQESDLAGEGLPELGLDFKRYFTIPTDVLYAQIEKGMCQRRTVLETPYEQHLTQRFSAYFARVALPQDYESE